MPAQDADTQHADGGYIRKRMLKSAIQVKGCPRYIFPHGIVGYGAMFHLSYG